MPISYPSILPSLPRTGSRIEPVSAFDIITTASSVVVVNRTLENPPLKYTTNIKLIGKGQISAFDDWFVKDLLNGSLRFNAKVFIPVNSGGVYECQFISPPTFSEIGTHTNRIKEVTLSFYVYNTRHAVFNSPAGQYPNIPAPITTSISETKTDMTLTGTTAYGIKSSTGAFQGTDTYSLTFLFNYDEFSIFDGWWSSVQGDGSKAFSAPILTSDGLKNMTVRPLGTWKAVCRAGDVEVSLTAECTRPMLTNYIDSQITDMGMTADDLQQINTETKAVWHALKGT